MFGVGLDDQEHRQGRVLGDPVGEMIVPALRCLSRGQLLTLANVLPPDDDPGSVERLAVVSGHRALDDVRFLLRIHSNLRSSAMTMGNARRNVPTGYHGDQRVSKVTVAD